MQAPLVRRGLHHPETRLRRLPRWREGAERRPRRTLSSNGLQKVLLNCLQLLPLAKLIPSHDSAPRLMKVRGSGFPTSLLAVCCRTACKRGADVDSYPGSGTRVGVKCRNGAGSCVDRTWKRAILARVSSKFWVESTGRVELKCLLAGYRCP